MTIRASWRHLLLVIALSLGGIACQASAADSPVSSIPYKRDSASSENDLLRLVIGLGICALAVAGSVYVIRRRLGVNNGETAKPKRLRVLETQRLNPRSALHVVEFAGTCYLVAESGQGMNCLASAPMPNVQNPEQT